MSFFEKESYQSPNDPKLSVKAQKTGTHKLHDSGDINSCSTNLLATYDINATDGLKQQIPQVHALKASQNKPLPYSMDHLIDQAENLSIHDDNANKNVNSVVEKSVCLVEFTAACVFCYTLHVYTSLQNRIRMLLMIC